MSTVQEAAADTHRGRTRQATDRKIVQAVLRIVTSQGVGAVTIEEVSRVSGVAKTTIYRRYRDAADLLRSINTLSFVRLPQIADLSPSRDNLHELLDQIERRFNESIGVKAVGIVLSTDNAIFRKIIDEGIVPVRQHVAEFFLRGEREGVFREGLDTDLLFGTIIGSMVTDRTIAELRDWDHDDNHASAHADGTTWADRMTDLLWPAIAI